MLARMRSLDSASRSARVITIAAGLLFVAACSDDDAPTSTPSDAGSGIDGGGDVDAGAPLPACTPLSEPAPFPCNPVDGTRCELSTGTRCVLDVFTDEAACVCLDDRKGFQEPCDPARLECAAGFACFALVDDPGPTCQKICDFLTGEGCQDIDQSGVDAFECAGLQGASEFGVCVFAGQACDLVLNDCPGNQTCTITGLQTACAGVGNQELGEECDLDARCQRGLICVEGPTDLEPVCNQVCDPEADEDGCPTFQRCNAFRSFPAAGICANN